MPGLARSPVTRSAACCIVVPGGSSRQVEAGVSKQVSAILPVQAVALVDLREHWEHIYTTKPHDRVSWFEPVPSLSLRLIESAGLTADTHVLDVGGGDSHLVDALLERGVRHVMVLDVSGVALDRARARLGASGSTVTWLEADATDTWSVDPVDIWHDRAVFHFLTEAHHRTGYRAHVHETLKPGGALIVATFAAQKPAVACQLCGTRPRRCRQNWAMSSRSSKHTHTSQSLQYSRFLRSWREVREPPIDFRSGRPERRRGAWPPGSESVATGSPATAARRAPKCRRRFARRLHESRPERTGNECRTRSVREKPHLPRTQSSASSAVLRGDLRRILQPASRYRRSSSESPAPTR